jgi:pyrimidine-specific ribonucleoside hydrolase
MTPVVIWLCCLILFLLAGCTSATSVPVKPLLPQGINEDADLLIIDTDMAADDWLAILFLLMRPDLDIQAITVTGAGEAHCGPGTRHALDLAAQAGRPDIPVACGAETPLAGHHTFPEEWRETVDNLLGLSLPTNPAFPSEETADRLLSRLIHEAPKKVKILVLGPLTNVAAALENDPGLIDNLDMITIMGGAVRVPGNVGSSALIKNDTAEWNFYVDPHAAAIVFQSGAPITLIPLDATNYVPLTEEFYRQLERDRANPVADFAYQILAAQEDRVGSGWYFLWDPLAASVLSDEGLVTFEMIPLVVVEKEGANSGRTQEDAAGSPVRVALSADSGRFEKLYLNTLNGHLP